MPPDTEQPDDPPPPDGGYRSEFCTLCSKKRRRVFDIELLQRHRVGYWFCDACGLLQTEPPYWLQEAYSAPILAADTGVLARNLYMSKRLGRLLFWEFGGRGKYVDIGGGYGLLVRLMRDCGFDFYWADPMCENLFARGFTAEAPGPFTAMTAFEVLEHVYDPIAFIRDAASRFAADTVVFSTELFEGEPPAPDSWWYLVPSGGQHVSLYQRRTLQYIASQLDMQLLSKGNLHMLTKRWVHQVPYRFWTSSYAALLDPLMSRRLHPRTEADHDAVVRLGVQPHHDR